MFKIAQSRDEGDRILVQPSYNPTEGMYWEVPDRYTQVELEQIVYEDHCNGNAFTPIELAEISRILKIGLSALFASWDQDPQWRFSRWEEDKEWREAWLNGVTTTLLHSVGEIISEDTIAVGSAAMEEFNRLSKTL